MNPLQSRRDFLALVQAAAALLVAPACAAGEAQSCADAGSESLRASLNYAFPSPDAAKTCGGCAFFTADASLEACGACTIMSGHVDETAVCDSWATPGG